MNLFYRIKTPFSASAEESAPRPEWPVHSVGRMLREQREELGLDLETAGAALRIKPIYLAALEQDRAQELPGPTYVVGFIRAYAHYLGFDGARVLARYKAESADVQLRPDLSFPMPLGERSLPGGPILLVAAIIALCGYGTWYYLATGARVRPERVAAVPAVLEHSPSLIPTPAKPPSVAPAAKAAAPSGAEQSDDGGAAVNPPAAAQPQPGGDPAAASTAADPGEDAGRAGGMPPVSPAAAVALPGAAAPAAHIVPADAAVPAGTTSDTDGKPAAQIDIRAVDDCWIQVRDAKQSILFSRVLKAGETYRVPPQPGLVMRVGNAGALTIAVDGKTAPPLGPAGALRRDVVLDPQALLAGTAVHD